MDLDLVRDFQENMQWVYGCIICCMCVRLCVYSMCVRLQDRDYTHDYKLLNWLIRQNREVDIHHREREGNGERESDERA